jgi:hypothetical protein
LVFVNQPTNSVFDEDDNTFVCVSVGKNWEKRREGERQRRTHTFFLLFPLFRLTLFFGSLLLVAAIGYVRCEQYVLGGRNGGTAGDDVVLGCLEVGEDKGAE